MQSLRHFFVVFLLHQAQKKAGLSCITQLRIPVKTLQPFFLGSKTHGASHSCCSIFVPVWSSNLKTDREVVQWGKEVPHLYGKRRLVLHANDYLSLMIDRNLEGNRGGFLMHI